MPFQVTNQTTGSVIEVNADETILDAALRVGKVFPYSCRSGTCSTCKADLISGEVDYGEYEQRALSEEEKTAGKLLLCQAKPSSDCVIASRELAAAASIQIKTLPCRVMGINKLAHDVVELELKLPANQSLSYLAGQYIDILLRDGRRRSFSIANKPEAEAALVLHVRHVPNGRFTGQVFETMRERDLLRFQGPFGTFFRRDDAASSKTMTPMILMAGGTGFAPIKAIVEQAIEDKVKRAIHIFWGARAKRDLYMYDIAQQWASEHENISFTPVLSEPVEADEWSAATGWVHDEVIRQHPKLAAVEVYASGPPPMIEAARPVFIQAGLADENLFFDSFEFNSDVTE